MEIKIFDAYVFSTSKPCMNQKNVVTLHTS